jgi:two-component system sensor histidine kinase TctE
LKYAPSDTAITVQVYTTPTLSINVKDEGVGFPVDEIHKLAGRFVRGSDTNGHVGSGLGLTIAQDVALAHGGKMILSNRPGGGACATLQF